jgi:ubiquinone/menaquinone biosynthesis C-methylase UbiE
MTGSVETFQLSVEAAGVAGGQAVLDVACGTGVAGSSCPSRAT